jgi:hypothetical protein
VRDLSRHLDKSKVRVEVAVVVSRDVPASNPAAAWSAVRPSSVDSIALVIAGFVLFSSSKPGVYIVGGKKM